MLRSFGIRAKILAVLALPVLVLALAAGVIATTAATDARKARQIEALTERASGLTDLVRGLGTERALTVAVLSGDTTQEPALAKVREGLDAGLAELRGTELDLSELDEQSKAGYAASQSANATLPELRRQVDGGILTPEQALIRYSEIIRTDIALPSAIADGVDDRTLANQLRAYTATLELLDAISIERDTTTPAVAAGGYDAASKEAAVDSARRSDLVRERTVGGQQRRRHPHAGPRLHHAAGPPAHHRRRRRRVREHRRAVLGRRLRGGHRLPRQRSDQADRRCQGPLLPARERRQQPRPAGHRGRRPRRGDPGRPGAVPGPPDHPPAAPPDRRRRADPRGAAEDGRADGDPGRGPRAVQSPRSTVNSNDEVGRLADGVQRRQQTTVARSPRSRPRCAAPSPRCSSTSPAATRCCCRASCPSWTSWSAPRRTRTRWTTCSSLDHLATRMRRNAESLLVLAGIDTGRRLRRPMPLSDVDPHRRPRRSSSTSGSTSPCRWTRRWSATPP